MGPADTIYICTPGIGAILLLIGSLIRWVQTRKHFYALPAAIALCPVANTALQLLVYPEPLPIGPLGNIAAILIGVVVIIIIAAATRQSSNTPPSSSEMP